MKAHKRSLCSLVAHISTIQSQLQTVTQMQTTRSITVVFNLTLNLTDNPVQMYYFNPVQMEKRSSKQNFQLDDFKKPSIPIYL